MKFPRKLLALFSLLFLVSPLSLYAQTLIGIHEIQGTGEESPLVGETVVVEGIITADYQDNLQLGGFYVQEEEEDADADPLTSEGVFVYCDPDDIYDFEAEGDTPNPMICSDNPDIADVTVGDLVRVEGEVVEFFGVTQIDARNGSVSVISSDNDLPASVELDIEGNIVEIQGNSADYYEAFEGMLVSIRDTLSVGEYFQLSRFGEVVLYQGERPYQYTHVDDTPTEAEFEDFRDDLSRRRIILDDGSNVENLPIVRSPQILSHPSSGLSIGDQGENFFRGGDTITGLTGILSFGFNNWRIYPVPYAEPVFTPVNLREAAPHEINGTLKVSSFNVLNYFTSLDGRGANSPEEFERQAEKIVTALAAIDADIFGLMEIENNVAAAVDLVDRLNRKVGADTYDFIDTGVIGMDEIAVAIIYKTSTVTPSGLTAVLDDESFTNPNNLDTPKNRPAIAQAFTETATSESLIVVVNHLKSKGSECGDGDDDPIQGNCNDTRTKAAQELLDWLATDPTETGEPDILIIGDLNSYAGEDPIDTIKAGGFHDLQGGVGTPNYSYVFDGQLGYLDHALASDSLVYQVMDVVDWHINADEIPVFDYNDDVLDGGERRFDQEPDGKPLYEPNAFRASDHDPVIIGLQLSE